MINAERIAEMKRLSAEATDGPWECHKFNGATNHHVMSTKVDGEGYCDFQTEVEREKDAIYIAESRQFVPDIIAAYDEQAEEIAYLKRTLAYIAKRKEGNADWAQAHNTLAIFGWPKEVE